jgi:hypothetical protein
LSGLSCQLLLGVEGGAPVGASVGVGVAGVAVPVPVGEGVGVPVGVAVVVPAGLVVAVAEAAGVVPLVMASGLSAVRAVVVTGVPSRVTCWPGWTLGRATWAVAVAGMVTVGGSCRWAGPLA